MPENQPPASGPARSSQVTTALWLASISVAFGLLSGAVSVIAGLAHHSLSVLAIGLGVLADVTGSAVLIWRFRAERRRAGQSRAAETRAASVVAAALAVVSAVIIVQSAVALATGSRPGTSSLALIAAGISLAVLTPLAYAKCRLGTQTASRALQGDGGAGGLASERAGQVDHHGGRPHGPLGRSVGVRAPLDRGVPATWLGRR
jgi:divalent metal cation (Fe/Co/Zn/Cd) transporter